MSLGKRQRSTYLEGMAALKRGKEVQSLLRGSKKTPSEQVLVIIQLLLVDLPQIGFFQVKCVTMEKSQKGLYKRAKNAQYYEVLVERSADYKSFAEAAAGKLKLEGYSTDSNELQLYRGDGTIITNQMPDGRSWTLGGYLTLIGRQPAQARFGVAYVPSDVRFLYLSLIWLYVYILSMSLNFIE